MSSSPINTGQLTPWSGSGDYNALLFAIQGALAKLNTATLCRVESCTVADGSVAAIGQVSVTALINQVDGGGNGYPHVELYDLPYFRLAAGNSAVIADPVAGDIGLMVVCSRDISKVKSTGGTQSNPGSARKFSMADGLYLGTVISAAAPTQYVQFSSAGVSIVTPQKIQLQSTGDTDLTASGKIQLQSSGDTDITASGNVVITGNSIQAGSSPLPVVSQPFIAWVTGTLIPALAAHSITVGPPPGDSLTSTFGAS